MSDTGSIDTQDDNTVAPQGAQTIAQTYADFALDLKYDDIPEGVRERAKYLILDSVGCALASSTFDFAAKILAGIKDLGGAGECSVINSNETLPVRDAVAMNAALVHGLDYDDTHMAAVLHASAVAFPPAFTFGEAVNAPGQDILTSYVIAMETGIRIGMAADFGFHHHGYHATGVCGHFSSVLVAGRMYGLTAPQLASAQGIVVSTATASQEFLHDGAWNKRLHPGGRRLPVSPRRTLAKSGFVGTGLLVTYPAHQAAGVSGGGVGC